MENGSPQNIALDPWAASSLLQKAIRRGEVTLAQSAALSLHRQRGNGIWSRLITIAFEDVGIGDLEAVSRTVWLGTDIALRNAVGRDTDIVLDLVAQLSGSPKDRSADYLYCAATRLRPSRHDRTLTSLRINHDLIAKARCLIDACVMPGAEERLPKREALIRRLNAAFVDCPSEMTELVGGAADRVRHPFILMLPLLSREVGENDLPRSIEQIELRRSSSFNGIPLYTFDKHTAVGKKAISRLLSSNAKVRSVLERFVSPGRMTDVAAVAAFYADAMPVSRRLMWQRSYSLEEVGLYADMVDAGCPANGVIAVVSCFREELAALDVARHAALSRRTAA